MNIIDKLNQEQIEQLGKTIPEFSAGDTLRVHVKITEGGRERIQVFEGICIARKNRGLQSAFTVRKISFGEGVERVFPLYSPTISQIERVRRGAVRRAKLYYLRGRTGKAARIPELKKASKIEKFSKDDKSVSAETDTSTDDAVKKVAAEA